MTKRATGGYVALHRSILSCPDLHTDVERWAWVRMLLLATHRPYGDLKPGQLRLSVRALSIAHRWSRSSAHRFLTRLEAAGMITRSTDASVITIQNWRGFQRGWDTKRDEKRNTQAALPAGDNGHPGTPSGTPSGTHIQEGSQEVPPTGGTPPAARRRVAGPEGEVLRAFDQHHRRTLGVGYRPCLPGGGSGMARDIKLARSLVKAYGLPFVLELVEAFWMEQGEAREDGKQTYGAGPGTATPTIPGLQGQVPNLLRLGGVKYRYQHSVGGEHGSAHR